jgi:hypothetical protein
MLGCMWFEATANHTDIGQRLCIRGAATQRWILEPQHSKTVLAHIGAFPKKCTLKHPFHTMATWKFCKFCENYITLFCLEENKLFDKIILTQNHAWHITQSG